jgi:hypothetical protein
MTKRVADDYVWRNKVDFDPLKKYGGFSGFSYMDVLGWPAAEVMREVWEPVSTRVSVRAAAALPLPWAAAAAARVLGPDL